MDSSVTWTAVAATAATLSALFAALYTWLTYRLFQAQTEGHVVVYVTHDESRSSLLLIVIQNVGRGLARDVRFEMSRPLPAQAWGLEEGSAEDAQLMSHGPLIEGIPSLGPGDSRKITWGQFGGLMKALGNEVVHVACRFKAGGRERETRSELDVRSFAGTDAISSEGARLVKEVSKVSKGLDGIAKVLERAR